MFYVYNLRVRTRWASGGCEPEREDSKTKIELSSVCGHTFNQSEIGQIGLVWGQDQREKIHIFSFMVLNWSISMPKSQNPVV